MGYIGGTSEKPTYASVCGGDGHTEALEVSYDPQTITYRELLDVFFESHPAHVQMPVQYKSAVFPVSEEQAKEAQAVLEERMQRGSGKRPHATVVEAPQQQFWKAEGWHQNYNQKNKIRVAALAVLVLLSLVDQNIPGVETANLVFQAGFLLSLAPQLVVSTWNSLQWQFSQKRG